MDVSGAPQVPWMLDALLLLLSPVHYEHTVIITKSTPILVTVCDT
jgi:hypothetical protein